MKVRLRVTEGNDKGRQFEFEARDRFLIGRAPTAHFQIAQDQYFSRHHAMLEVNPPNVLLQDLQSRNGTYVNNQRAQAPVHLKHGDTIWGGKTRIEVIIEEPRPSGPMVVPETLPVGPTQLPPQTPAVTPGPKDKVPVRCLRCGAAATNELPRSRAENMTYFCDPCQTALLAEPKIMPEYQVVKELGRGGMGAVYLAVQAQLGRRVAIKMILPRAAMSQRIRDMFVREAAAQAMLDHPRVVRVIDFRETSPGIFCMVMEYIEGQSADDLLKENPHGLEPRLAGTIVAQALEGLGHAHARGVVHRDIKDANLLVGRDEYHNVSVKLSDFGLAKSYETSGASGFTRTGDVSGTVPYMAPEQILDFRNVRPPADIYSMGATLYHLLTNQLAYDFSQKTDPLVTILEKPIVPIAQRKPGVPSGLAAAVDKAMAKEPAARFRSAEEMRAAILAAIS